MRRAKCDDFSPSRGKITGEWRKQGASRPQEMFVDDEMIMDQLEADYDNLCVKFINKLNVI